MTRCNPETFPRSSLQDRPGQLAAHTVWQLMLNAEAGAPAARPLIR
jgi:hypothetical protein